MYLIYSPLGCFKMPAKDTLAANSPWYYFFSVQKIVSRSIWPHIVSRDNIMLNLSFELDIKHDTSTKHWTPHLLWPTKLSYRPGHKGFERYLGRFCGLVCVTHPWSQKAISGMSNCQHRGAIASPWIGHAFHCPSYWFQPQDLFDGFNIFNIVNILLLQIDSSRKICLTL